MELYEAQRKLKQAQVALEKILYSHYSWQNYQVKDWIEIGWATVLLPDQPGEADTLKMARYLFWQDCKPKCWNIKN